MRFWMPLILVAVALLPTGLSAQTSGYSRQDAEAISQVLLDNGKLDGSPFHMDIDKDTVLISPLLHSLKFGNYDAELFTDPELPLDSTITLEDWRQYCRDLSVGKVLEMEAIRRSTKGDPQQDKIWKPQLTKATTALDEYLKAIYRHEGSAKELRDATVRFKEAYDKATVDDIKQWAADNGKSAPPVSFAPGTYSVKFVAKGVQQILTAEGGEFLLYRELKRISPQRQLPLPRYVIVPTEKVIQRGRYLAVKATLPDNSAISAPEPLAFSFDHINIVTCTPSGIALTLEEK